MKSLFNFEETTVLIEKGKVLQIAGDEALLNRLPKGSWIGGTIPYFMGDEGGVISKEKIYVKELNEINKLETIKSYSPDELPTIPQHYPENGISYIIAPVFSKTHGVFAKDIIYFDGILNSPLIGWIAGVHLDEFPTGKKPKVFNGQTGEVFEDKAVIMHTTLPDDTYAKVEIVNIFEDEDDADVINFIGVGNVVGECLVNGKKTTLAEYLVSEKHNTQQPLIGDFMGEKLNVAIQSIDEETKEVALYAPVFQEIDYKLSKPVADYSKAFMEKLDVVKSVETGFACNCVLNFLYGNMEGKKTGKMTGPMTFGEIAYLLLNQTMVFCTFHKK